MRREVAMRSFRYVPSLVLALVAVPIAVQAQLGVDMTNPVWFGTSSPLVLGWSFTVGGPLSVIALGFVDYGGDGLIGSHDVGIFSSGGTLLAETTVTTFDPLTSFWRFASIAPLSLGTGTYLIAATVGNQTWPFWDYLPAVINTGTATFDPDISYLTDWSLFPASSLTFPTTPDCCGNVSKTLVPNFIVGTVTPEPPTILLLATGLIGAVGTGLVRRRKA